MLLVNITLPVYNEEAQLSSSVSALGGFLEAHRELSWEVVIADNGSTDGTLAAARDLSQRAHIRVAHSDRKGRGGAVKQVWLESTADILSYMDINLSTDLAALPLLIDALASGRFDVATGSRLQAASVTTRSWQREVVSRCYNWIVKAALRTRFSDAQCGFKAITREAAARLLPAVEDTGWFFDTELLVLAEKSGYRIYDLPVRWTEDQDSRVKILSTVWADLRGIIRLYRKLRRGACAGLATNPIPTK